MKKATAKLWAEGVAKLRQGTLDANALACAVAQAETGEDSAITAAEFAAETGSRSA